MPLSRRLARKNTGTVVSCQRPHWRRNSFFIVSVLALLVPVKSIVAGEETQTGGISFAAGKEKSSEARCQECHGADGNSVDAKIPNHAGQYAAYLIKQLSDFQTGARKHEIMTIMAEDLSVNDMADISAYFADREVMKGDGASRSNRLGANLFAIGDPAKGIPACAGCHGENGKGRIADNTVYPVIGGQRKIYLRSQLVAWKLGERGNSPGGVMNKVAQLLSDDEIEALADYVSGL